MIYIFNLTPIGAPIPYWKFDVGRWTLKSYNQGYARIDGCDAKHPLGGCSLFIHHLIFF
jgi:hypothetical protein